MRRSSRRRPSGEWFAHALESRFLPTSGLAGVADVLRELGQVSLVAAASGVEAMAQIDSGKSVTFRFEVEATGNYTLLVRHTGEGLTLEESGPTGSATLDSGPAGPFQAIPLRLSSTVYEITASARGGQPIFVDWELLLNSGVGQSAATEPVVVLSSYAPSPAGSTPSSVASASVGLATSDHSDGNLNPSPTPPNSSPSSNAMSAYRSASLPIGQPRLRDLTPLGESTADAPVIIAAAEPVSVPEPEPVPMLAIAITQALQPSNPIDQFEQDASAELTGWSRLMQASTADPVEEGQETEAETVSGGSVLTEISVATIGPGLLIGAVGVTIASQARLKSSRKPIERKLATPFPPSMQPFLRFLAKKLDASPRSLPRSPLARRSWTRR